MRRRDDAPSRRTQQIPAHIWWPEEGVEFPEWKAAWNDWWNTLPATNNLPITNPDGKRVERSIVFILSHQREVKESYKKDSSGNARNA